MVVAFSIIMNIDDVIYAFKKLAIIEVLITSPVLIYCMFNLNQQTISVIAGILFVYFITLVLFVIYLIQS